MIPDPSLSIDDGAIAVLGWQSVTNEGSFTRATMEALAKNTILIFLPLLKTIRRIFRISFFMERREKKSDVHYVGQRVRGVYIIEFEGWIKNVEWRYRETASDTTKQEYETFMRITPCSECGGRRLKKESLAVTVGDRNIAEICDYSIGDLKKFVDGLDLTPTQLQIGKLILREIKSRLGFLLDVGLEYLSLSRATSSLSGGEAQRIRLATQIGSGSCRCCLHFDEPSIGLHQRDNDKLIKTLQHLKDLGNTLIVVEHDEDTMLAADYIVDIGPGAGEHGGQVVATGNAQEIMKNPASITGAYL